MAAGRANRGPGRTRLRDALRAYRAALDRTAGRASGSQDLARSALVALTRRGGRLRASDAVRIDLGGAPHRHVCQTGSTACAFDLLARGAGALRTGCADGFRARECARAAAGA